MPLFISDAQISATGDPRRLRVQLVLIFPFAPQLFAFVPDHCLHGRYRGTAHLLTVFHPF